MIHLSSEELATVLVDDRKRLIFILVPSDRELKISRISKSICSYRSKIRNHKVAFVDLNKPPSSISLTFDCKLNTSLNYSNLLWMDDQNSIFSLNLHNSLLGHEKHVTI